ncbi:MAG: DUF805 domain-containing protein [Endomicrobiaceae bacterium]|nr:DUF805 domain-containing protein [Endomicrobiaceae bacterium]
MNYVKTYFLDIITKHFFDFNGTEGRKVYWLFVLNNFIVSFLLGLISSTLSYIFSIVVLLPALGILVRRLHDAGFSGWWALLLLVPGIGWIAIVILACLPSKK